MRVLGIDPGTHTFGWGVVERSGTRLRHLGHGAVQLGKGDLADRLLAIDRALTEVIARLLPDASAVEAMFYAKNAQSAAKLGHARGVVLLSLRRAGLSVGEYPPARVKLAVVGRGRADKIQVAHMVAAILGLAELPPTDAADALAVAITHLNAVGFAEALLARRSGDRR